MSEVTTKLLCRNFIKIAPLESSFSAKTDFLTPYALLLRTSGRNENISHTSEVRSFLTEQNVRLIINVDLISRVVSTMYTSPLNLFMRSYSLVLTRYRRYIETRNARIYQPQRFVGCGSIQMTRMSICVYIHCCARIQYMMSIRSRTNFLEHIFERRSIRPRVLPIIFRKRRGTIVSYTIKKWYSSYLVQQ